MRVLLYIFMYFCIYVSVKVFRELLIFECKDVSIYVCIYVCLYVCTYVCECVCMSVFMYVCMYVCN